MSVIAEPAEPTGIDIAFEPTLELIHERSGWLPTRAELGAAAVLGAASIAAFYGQRYGYTKPLPAAPEYVATGMGHPGIGFWAGCLAAKASQKIAPESGGKMVAGAVGAATAVNFVAEWLQYKLYGSAETFFMKDVAETTKDYIFALGGTALVLAQKPQRGQAMKLFSNLKSKLIK